MTGGNVQVLVALLEVAVVLGDTTAMHVLVEPLKVAADLAVVDNSMTVVARHLGAAMASLGDLQQAIACTLP